MANIRMCGLAACALLLTACSAGVRTAGDVATCGEGAACAASAGGVRVLSPLLARRIETISARSPTFRDEWRMIEASGVSIRIGTDEQLQRDLPGWYRRHRSRWVGLTVVSGGGRRRVDRAVVAIQLTALERMSRSGVPTARSWFLSEVDRVLVHEIYGHLAPVLASRDAFTECPDHVRSGEERPCVAVREERITHELQAMGSMF